jgi:cytochrome oxidase assembly protein ShyY1
MTRRIPLIATLLVLIAVGVMIALGVWQLDRLAQKEALIARYSAALSASADVPYPASPEKAEPLLYRHARINCARVLEWTAIAGRSASGESGQAHVARCRLADGREARVVAGWSRNPNAPAWGGGTASGTIAPGPRLVADPPLAGLEANARPDPNDIPNNHFAYAVQWFLFAGVALVIYVLALRKRLAAAARER